MNATLLIACLAAAPAELPDVPDVSKRLIEDDLIASLAEVAVDPARDPVEPGLVPWHASYAAACAAAAESGKPVLLFQLLGRLDDAFC